MTVFHWLIDVVFFFGRSRKICHFLPSESDLWHFLKSCVRALERYARNLVSRLYSSVEFSKFNKNDEQFVNINHLSNIIVYYNPHLNVVNFIHRKIRDYLDILSRKKYVYICIVYALSLSLSLSAGALFARSPSLFETISVGDKKNEKGVDACIFSYLSPMPGCARHFSRLTACVYLYI